MLDERTKLPMPFIFRRLHSILGGWLVIYLFQHLLVNSQAALFFKDRGSHFISMVNKLESLPFLPAVEILFIALPFVIHMVWGVMYLRTARSNSAKSDGRVPSLPQYPRNRAYTWQRMTSWVLIPAILLHVIHMRFLNPIEESEEGVFSVRVVQDEKLEKTMHELHGKLVEKEGILRAEIDSPGKAFFLIVRESFKNPLLVLLYSLFVIFASYHAFNGLWTMLIKWGVSLTQRAQRNIKIATLSFMWLSIFFGLFSVWGTYIAYVS